MSTLDGAGAAARRRLLAATALAVVASRAVGAPPASPEGAARIRDILERARSQAGASTTSPERRLELLASAESALAQGNADAAGTLFEQAGFIKHAADAELGLIRAYMQQGEYRRALAFAAHTAGAHPDVAEGSALYAWLLHLGGQTKIAGLIIERARARLPAASVLAEAQSMLAVPQPTLAAALLEPPGRFAPYSPSSVVLPATSRVLGSGVLMRSGRGALTSVTVTADHGSVWVRDGLGRISAARRKQFSDLLGLVELELTEPIVAPAPALPQRDPFPGSPGYLVEFVPGPGAEPAWPMLRLGFLGAASNTPGIYALGIDADRGPRGGPVFGSAGQLVGLAVSPRSVGDRIVLASQVQNFLGETPPAATLGAGASNLAADEIYERALAVTVQVIGER